MKPLHLAKALAAVYSPQVPNKTWRAMAKESRAIYRRRAVILLRIVAKLEAEERS